eukprot:2269093-Pleurochrysis_carterae.AAC.1
MSYESIVQSSDSFAADIAHRHRRKVKAQIVVYFYCDFIVAISITASAMFTARTNYCGHSNNCSSI